MSGTMTKEAKEGAVTLTKGPIWQRMILFAIPILLGNIFQQLYNAADSLIVGNVHGRRALAAVSSSGNLIFLLVGFFNGIAIGAGVVIAKHYGAKEYEDVRLAVHTDLAFGVLAGGLLTVVGVLFTPVILRLMGTPETVLPNSIIYFRIYFLGVTGTVLYNISMGILQAVGDSRHPLYYLIISSVTNVILDLILVAGFHFGVWAAALATAISQMLSAILCIRRLIREETVYQVRLKEVRVNRRMMRQIIRYGLPSGIQNSIISFANVIVQSNINSFGESAMAGCGSYAKLEGFAFLPVTCFSMALTTFIGQNLGAKLYDRAKKGAVFGLVCGMIMAEILGLGFWLFAPQLIGLFAKEAEVISFGVRQARVEALFFFLLTFSHCSAGIMRGAGRAYVPMITMMVVWCVIRVTYITLMLRVIPDIRVIFSAYPITWGISSVVFLIYLLKADWIHAFDKEETQK